MMPTNNEQPQSAGKTIGTTVAVNFVTVGNKSIEGKVDTGATTSSLHATNISVNAQQVSFQCPELSNNVITMAIAGSQDVSSADGGEQARPIVKMDVSIDGVTIRDASFNLNDRSNMDVMVLIGQNILKAGGFIIDVNQGGEEQPTHESVEVIEPTRAESVAKAIQTLIECNVSLEEIIRAACITQ